MSLIYNQVSPFLTKKNVGISCICFSFDFLWILLLVRFLFFSLLELINRKPEADKQKKKKNLSLPDSDIIQMVSEKGLTYEFSKIYLSV